MKLKIILLFLISIILTSCNTTNPADVKKSDTQKVTAIKYGNIVSSLPVPPVSFNDAPKYFVFSKDTISCDLNTCNSMCDPPDEQCITNCELNKQYNDCHNGCSDDECHNQCDLNKFTIYVVSHPLYKNQTFQFFKNNFNF